MSWNYRVLKRIWDENGPFEQETFDIRQVYYDKQTKAITSYSANAISPCGSSLKQLKQDRKRQSQAFKKPVLWLKQRKTGDQIWQQSPSGQFKLVKKFKRIRQTKK